MKICEGCIKQDVCKFKEGVEKYEDGVLPDVAEVLVIARECRYKRSGMYTWTYNPSQDLDTTAVQVESVSSLEYPWGHWENPELRWWTEEWLFPLS